MSGSEGQVCSYLKTIHAIYLSIVNHLYGSLTQMLIVGATLACGTGACATVVAAVLEGHAGRVSFYKLYFSVYT